MRNLETFTFKGGLRNKHTRIVMNSGMSIVHSMGAFLDQTNGPRTVIERTTHSEKNQENRD